MMPYIRIFIDDVKEHGGAEMSRRMGSAAFADMTSQAIRELTKKISELEGKKTDAS